MMKRSLHVLAAVLTIGAITSLASCNAVTPVKKKGPQPKSNLKGWNVPQPGDSQGSVFGLPQNR